MKLPNELYKDVVNFCELNGINNLDEYLIKCTKQGHLMEKYGNAPIDLTPEVVEKIVEVEVEVIKEVPVEVEKIVEKEVEVIKEVPVEKIVEIEVEKEVYKTDDKTINKLTKKIEDLKMEITKITNKSNKLECDNNKKDEELNLQKVENLRILKELKEEKRKPKREKKEIKLPESTTRRSSINWVSKDERDGDNFYND